MRSPGATEVGAGALVGAALGFAGADGADGAPGAGVAAGFTGADGAPGAGLALGLAGAGAPGLGAGLGDGATGAPDAIAGVSSEPDARTAITPIAPRRSTAPMRVPSVKVEPS